MELSKVQQDIPRDHNGIFSAGTLTARFPEPAAIPPDALWVLVKDTGVYVTPGTLSTIFVSGPPENHGFTGSSIQYLGHYGEIPCYAAGVAEPAGTPEGREFAGVRTLFGKIPDDELAIASLAVRLVTFDRNTRFCGRCGAETRQLLTERAKLCDDCKLITYPRISPAIIVLVQNGDRILLARSPRFPPGQYSVVAGFVESGENLGHAVRREVREETGIEITNIRYFGSEPWPFPDSLMIGFTADYAGGEIRIDNNEIVSADWFDRDHLPLLPSKMSISRALIDQWISQRPRHP
jgi:NAD+ diphosphatase